MLSYCMNPAKSENNQVIKNVKIMINMKQIKQQKIETSFLVKKQSSHKKAKYTRNNHGRNNAFYEVRLFWL